MNDTWPEIIDRVVAENNGVSSVSLTFAEGKNYCEFRDAQRAVVSCSTSTTMQVAVESCQTIFLLSREARLLDKSRK
jgi:hypothetical protein